MAHRYGVPADTGVCVVVYSCYPTLGRDNRTGHTWIDGMDEDTEEAGVLTLIVYPHVLARPDLLVRIEGSSNSTPGRYSKYVYPSKHNGSR